MTKRFDYWRSSGAAAAVASGAAAASGAATQRHQVWYDDAETLSAKYRAVVRQGGRGVAMWTANMGDDAMWEALRAVSR